MSTLTPHRALVACLVSLGVATAAAPLADAKVLSIATLAPRNSTWMKYFRKMAREISKKTGGAVKLKFHPDGSRGDEALVVEKMRLGELHGAAITNVGLGKIQPAILVQQLPLLFRNYKELDCLRAKMNDKFSALLMEKGFVALGYGDVGFIYNFSKHPVRKPADFAAMGAKVWAWTDDPIGRAIQQEAGIATIPLSVPDVLSSLQTGGIDTFYNAPYAAMALQWFTHAKYIVNLKLAVAVGATVLTKAAWDGISAEHQPIVRAAMEKWGEKLNKRLRGDNRRAVKVLTKEHGLEVVKLTKNERKVWRTIARKVHKSFTGSLYSAELLSEVKATIKTCRGQ